MGFEGEKVSGKDVCVCGVVDGVCDECVWGLRVRRRRGRRRLRVGC